MNTAFKRTLLSTLVVPFALGAASASAAMITDWGYDTTNVFQDAVFDSGGSIDNSIAASQSLSWGEDGGSTATPNGTRSSVSITNVSETSGLMTNGDFVSGGVFTHNNNIIDTDYATLTSFNLSTTLLLTAFAPDTGDSRTVGPQIFQASFSETLNRAPCQGTSTGVPCDDIFTINNLPEGATANANGWFELSADSFTLDDYSYTVFLELQNLLPLGAPTCGVAGAPENCIGLLTQEEKSNSFDTRFRIAATPVSVPEPGTLALLGLGLAGLGLSSRRKKAAKA